MKTKAWIKQIEKRQAAIGLERDKLDQAISEMEGLREDYDEAWHHLQDARDALSRMV